MALVRRGAIEKGDQTLGCRAIDAGDAPAATEGFRGQHVRDQRFVPSFGGESKLTDRFRKHVPGQRFLEPAELDAAVADIDGDEKGVVGHREQITSTLPQWERQPLMGRNDRRGWRQVAGSFRVAAAKFLVDAPQETIQPVTGSCADQEHFAADRIG